jgi:hypothetical protein
VNRALVQDADRRDIGEGLGEPAISVVTTSAVSWNRFKLSTAILAFCGGGAS